MTCQALRRAPGVAFTVLVLGLSLAACSGQTLTVAGQEVQDFDHTITKLDDAWKQSLTDGKKANVAKDDGSRCYAQINGEALADQAICGPVHYLGVDETTWDTVSLNTVVGDSSNKVKLEKGSGFTTGKKKDNAELYRPDGKQPPGEGNVPEPDAKTADSEQAIWMQTSSPQTPSGSATDAAAKPLVIQTPDAKLTISNPKVTDRIGGPEDRLQASEGHKFGAVTFSTVTFGAGNSETSTTWGNSNTAESKTVLAFTSGGKNYNVGKPQNGTVAMSVPGGGKDLALTVTYADKAQILSLANGSLDDKSQALPYYDGYNISSVESAKVGDLKIEKQNGFSLTFHGTSFTAYRDPYDPAVGWAPEGKTWLRISGNPYTSNLQWASDKGWNYGYYTVLEDIVSGTMTNVSGDAFTAELKSHQGQQPAPTSWSGTSQQVSAIFEVPVKATDFKASFVLRAAGTLKKDQSSTAAPATASFDSPVKDLQFTFPQK